jgi:hypothetical protein
MLIDGTNVLPRIVNEPADKTPCRVCVYVWHMLFALIFELRWTPNQFTREARSHYHFWKSIEIKF